MTGATGRRRPTPSSPDDPDRRRFDLYEAETQALPDGGRRFTRFVDLTFFVDGVVADDWWSDRFPGAPLEVAVERRSHTARYSCAHVERDGSAGLILIRSGSWDMVTVIHELAHVGVSAERPRSEASHGEAFTSALVDLWRRHLGFHAYGALRSALDERALPYRRERRPGLDSP